MRGPEKDAEDIPAIDSPAVGEFEGLHAIDLEIISVRYPPRERIDDPLPLRGVMERLAKRLDLGEIRTIRRVLRPPARHGVRGSLAQSSDETLITDPVGLQDPTREGPGEDLAQALPRLDRGHEADEGSLLMGFERHDQPQAANPALAVGSLDIVVAVLDPLEWTFVIFDVYSADVARDPEQTSSIGNRRLDESQR